MQSGIGMVEEKGARKVRQNSSAFHPNSKEPDPLLCPIDDLSHNRDSQNFFVRKSAGCLGESRSR